MTAKAANQQTVDEITTDLTPISFARIMVALDASEHADRALAESLRIADSDKGDISGIHAYAAQLHDRRFRQMEGGLPERYLEEQEMNYQREVHDDLITSGLNIISDSYHDVASDACEKAGFPYKRLSPEGKNYAKIIEAVVAGEYDLLALGALGLGAIPGSQIGTVCERVVRRSPVDTLVIKDPKVAIGEGPIVVGIDGSDLSNGALRTAFEISRRTGAPIHAVAAYDPYYHYVAFNAIADVLSDEAGKVFRFKEQEKLHEELIDDGIAKIYQSHLEIAQRTASDEGMKITTELLDGKVFTAILAYLDKVGASLLLIGKTGVHADAELDIGGNAENLLRMSKCHVWLSVATTHTPEFDVVAEETTSWSNEAEEMISRAPSFVQGMARKSVLRFAHEKGHTFITSDMVKEVMGMMMPGQGGDGADEEPLVLVTWSDGAEALLETLEPHLANNIRFRAEKRARRDDATRVMPEHVAPFLEQDEVLAGLSWDAAALARLARVPEKVRDRVKFLVEETAHEKGVKNVNLALAEEIISEIRSTMCPVPEEEG